MAAPRSHWIAILALLLAAAALPAPAAGTRPPPADATTQQPSASPQLPPGAADASAIVRSNYEMHAALTNENITHVYLANNITMTLSSCPPGTEIFRSSRNLTVSTLPGAPAPYWFDCGLLPTRMTLASTLTFARVGITNCLTDSAMGYIRLLTGGHLMAIHNPTLCPSYDDFLSDVLHGPRPTTAPGPQRMERVGPGWCSQPGNAALAEAVGANAAAGGALCATPVVLMRDVASIDPGVNREPAAHVVMSYRDSVLLCTDPRNLTAACAGQKDALGCIADVYGRINPDRPFLEAKAAEAAADARRQTALRAGVGTAAAIVGAVALGLAALALLRHRRRRDLVWGRPAPEGFKGGPAGSGGGGGGFVGAPAGTLLGSPGTSEGSGGMSSVPVSGGGRRSGDASRRSGDAGRRSGDAGRPQLRPDGITLGVLMGAGATGRVYAGRWKGQMVAVKVLTHSAADEPLIEHELRLSETFRHPNVTSALHFTKVKLARTAEPTPDWANGGADMGPGTPTPNSPRAPPRASVEVTTAASQNSEEEEEEDAAGAGAAAASGSGGGGGGGEIKPSSSSSGGGGGRPDDGSGGGMRAAGGGAVAVFRRADLPQNHTPAAAAASQRVDTETWIVMEMMDQGTLGGAVHAGRLLKPVSAGGGWRALLLRARDAAAGLAYLHGRGVVHADVKARAFAASQFFAAEAENVLLATDPDDEFMLRAKVADFGLSRALLSGQTHETTRHFGTVSHQPPELLARGKLSPAGDVYRRAMGLFAFFGIMLWGLVNGGERPFGDMLHGEIINRVIHQALRPAFKPGTWSPYVQLVRDCWQQDPEARPTMQRVLERIEALVQRLEAEAEAEAARAARAAPAPAASAGGGAARGASAAGGGRGEGRRGAAYEGDWSMARGGGGSGNDDGGGGGAGGREAAGQAAGPRSGATPTGGNVAPHAPPRSTWRLTVSTLLNPGPGDDGGGKRQARVN
ncbi:hypothetical protein Rsub_02682 [Raphidocelis subcapitata]|uniref:Protein kinase domain-containing protein n=1 Tax=Raphidocelis subcapitata TaxID=307507 RepID=A0A2V0NQQ2_9CHLO|nr:hypothetical protein Rsub_02682 [Raphidocelis subcapitata]|eukprot:GBF89976.1 hypothetical protein Rsub_02682 [Raphidocelis subcapitata]